MAATSPPLTGAKPLTDGVYVVTAYDDTGDRRIPTPLRLGDEIDWKRTGTAGSYRARVLGFRPDNSGRTRILIDLRSHDGRPIPGGRVRSITSGILRVHAKCPLDGYEVKWSNDPGNQWQHADLEHHVTAVAYARLVIPFCWHGTVHIKRYSMTPHGNSIPGMYREYISATEEINNV